MKKIRNMVFETNSSSVHSMVIVTDDELEKLNSEELVFDKEDNVINKEEAIKSGKPYFTIEQWIDNIYDRDLLYDVEEYKCKCGEHINMLIEHGYNG